ncbi:hypothetical protein [Kitasatospora brasiliensis]|uniref:hypothetical protein n=1 Tax=Kitasatospora brasiliensis TaxID=3058040 RepID=UPI00292CB490|nr:hypothetical protein [Kitasatospora sp. K002]
MSKSIRTLVVLLSLPAFAAAFVAASGDGIGWDGVFDTSTVTANGVTVAAAAGGPASGIGWD